MIKVNCGIGAAPPPFKITKMLQLYSFLFITRTVYFGSNPCLSDIRATSLRISESFFSVGTCNWILDFYKLWCQKCLGDHLLKGVHTRPRD